MTTILSEILFDGIIRDHKPISLVRCGDGEAIVLNKFKDPDKLKMVLKRQFGFLPPWEHIDELHDHLVNAYKTADVIGIPVNKREGLNSYWHKAIDILKSKLGKDVFEGKILANIDFHLHWLDAGFFDTLLSGIDTLCYISCRNLDDRFKERFGIKNVYSFQIAPEAKFTSGYTGLPHYPDQFRKIEKWITRIPVEGSVCLVGAGFTGKIYNSWFRDRGGISIDIGCVFDMWAGRVTRGEERGLDVIDKTYML